MSIFHPCKSSAVAGVDDLRGDVRISPRKTRLGTLLARPAQKDAKTQINARLSPYFDVMDSASLTTGFGVFGGSFFLMFLASCFSDFNPCYPRNPRLWVSTFNA
jgi:hypothetical protein